MEHWDDLACFKRGENERGSPFPGSVVEMERRAVVFLSIVALGLATSRVRRIVGGNPAEVPPPPSANIQYITPEPLDRNPLVFVKRERKSAEILGSNNPDGTYSFLGIRYAEPPVKSLRFGRPRRLKPKGLVEAKKFGPPCPQWFYRKIIGDEDCLFLNVFTPEIPSNNSNRPSYPVLLWIHGGNFKTGSASQYIPSHLVKKGLVVVTLQYRLGSLGFLSLSKKELPGNAGLWDIALAAHWVKNYIRFFGGNPDRIIAGGQGSGASCASHLAINKILGRNVKGVVAMSGTPISPFAIDESELRSAEEVAKVDGCKIQNGLSFVRCMQNLPLDTVMKGDSSYEVNKKKQSDTTKKLANLLTPGPAEEGKDDFRFLPNFILESPLEAIQHGNFPKIPLLTGVTKKETGAGVQGNLLSEFTKLLGKSSFLTQGLFKDLLKASTGLYVNKTVNPTLNKLFSSSEYLKFFTNIVSSTLSDIGKIIEHTTDALFNLPAFILSNMWSKRSNVYLYSFEHSPPKSFASNFLNDITLVSNQSSASENKDGPSHGDDLMYLFDVRSLDGKPLPDFDSLLSETDKRVRDHFTTAVVEFANDGTPKTDGGGVWTPFNAKNGNYMIIKENPQMAEGFRKCSMGLWTGNTDFLQSTECSLSEASKIVTNTLGSAGTGLLTTVDGLNGAVTGGGIGRVGTNVVGQLLPSKGLGAVSGNNNTTKAPSKAPTKLLGLNVPTGGGLFG